ncbi:hypothetical protein [Xenophilus sp.]|uniref:hypothetical protein n=1 Tax=Xenophilus sp. TaxID=1873499 RepID=UPI0037DD4B1C
MATPAPGTAAVRSPAGRRVLRGLAVAAAALAVLLLAGIALLAAWLPDDEALARRAAAEFERRFGVAVNVGGAHWALRPAPVIVFEQVATRQPQPITLRRLAAYPSWRAALSRRIELVRVEAEGLVLPRASVRAFRGREAAAGEAPAGGGWTLAPVPVQRVVFRDATWIDRRGIALAYDGEVEFGTQWRPRRAVVERPGVTPPARLRLARQEERYDDSDGRGDMLTERWRVDIDVGGGTWNGEATLTGPRQGRLRLQAALSPRGVDLEALVGAFGRRSAVSGRVDGETTLEAEGGRVGELVRSLHTRTRFTVRPATLRHFDLARTVRTAGRQREGQTVLDELTGVLDTRSTGDGVRLRYSGLKARSGVLGASGRVQVLNRRLSGDIAVDLVDGVVGMPLRLGGTLDAPQLSLSGGALAGAAAGNAVLPGAGAVIGARIGQQLEQWFDDDDEEREREERQPKEQAPPAGPARR